MPFHPSLRCTTNIAPNMIIEINIPPKRVRLALLTIGPNNSNIPPITSKGPTRYPIKPISRLPPNFGYPCTTKVIVKVILISQCIFFWNNSIIFFIPKSTHHPTKQKTPRMWGLMVNFSYNGYNSGAGSGISRPFSSSPQSCPFFLSQLWQPWCPNFAAFL